MSDSYQRIYKRPADACETLLLVPQQVQVLSAEEQASNRKMQSLKNRIRLLDEPQIKMDNA